MTAYADKQAELNVTPCAYAVITGDYCARTYGVAPCTAAGAAGTECCNTFPTCQDRTNFSRTTKNYEFSSHEKPLPFSAGERPYIKTSKPLPTEIKDSLTVNGRLTLEMTDEPGTDVGLDPYVSTRTSVQGSYWKKWLARNPNFKGRPLKYYEGFIGLTKSDFTTDGKRFTGILDNITLGRGTVKIEAVDILKALDQVEIPKKLNLKLANNILAADVSITLSGDDVSSLDSPTGYVRIDDEIVYYGAINTTTKIISSCTRAQFSTTAADHNDGTKVQKTKYYAEDNPFDTMQAVLTDGGIPAGDVDTTAFTTEKAFVDDLNVYAVISEPVKASILYYELVDLMGCKTWVDENLQITIARNLPNHPDRTYTTITDTANILADSGSVDLNQKGLVTRCSLYWDKDALGKEDDAASYARLTLALDADAEGVNEYNQVAEKKIMSRWVHSGVTGSTEESLDGWITSVACRAVWMNRDPLPLLNIDVAVKDGDLATGKYAMISTDELQDAGGDDLADEVFQVVKREKKGDRITLKCLRMVSKKICYFAPAGTPDYDDATAEERQKYGYFTGADGRMADGTGGYNFY
jgi:hypothetical protein